MCDSLLLQQRFLAIHDVYAILQSVGVAVCAHLLTADVVHAFGVSLLLLCLYAVGLHALDGSLGRIGVYEQPLCSLKLLARHLRHSGDAVVD